MRPLGKHVSGSAGLALPIHGEISGANNGEHHGENPDGPQPCLDQQRPSGDRIVRAPQPKRVPAAGNTIIATPVFVWRIDCQRGSRNVPHVRPGEGDTHPDNWRSHMLKVSTRGRGREQTPPRRVSSEPRENPRIAWPWRATGASSPPHGLLDTRPSATSR